MVHKLDTLMIYTTKSIDTSNSYKQFNKTFKSLSDDVVSQKV